jgi:hypothetical protein
MKKPTYYASRLVHDNELPLHVVVQNPDRRARNRRLMTVHNVLDPISIA